MEAAGDLMNAVAKMRQAVEHAPERQDLELDYQRLSQRLSVAMADTYEQQAIHEQERQAWGAAAIAWARVAEGRPTASEPARLAAEAILKAEGDLARAKSLAQQAVERDPVDLASRVLLGRIYLAAGMPLNARRELQVAAELAPADPQIQELLRDAAG